MVVLIYALKVRKGMVCQFCFPIFLFKVHQR